MPRSDLLRPESLSSLLEQHGVSGVSIAALCPSTGNGDATVATQTAGLADSAGTPLFDSTLLQIASLSKPIAATFAVEYFAEAGISLEVSVNDALAAAGSPLRLRAAAGMPAEWAETVTLRQVQVSRGERHGTPLTPSSLYPARRWTTLASACTT